MKKLIKVLIVLVATIICMSSFTSLVKTSTISSNNYVIPNEVKEKIKSETVGMEILQIARYCVALTADMLEFSKVNVGNKANCVGYSEICVSLCKYAYKINNKKITVKHVRGYVDLFGFNLCKVLSSIVPNNYKNFVKDHDFIEIITNRNIIYLDPSLYDIFGNMMIKVCPTTSSC